MAAEEIITNPSDEKKRHPQSAADDEEKPACCKELGLEHIKAFRQLLEGGSLQDCSEDEGKLAGEAAVGKEAGMSSGASSRDAPSKPALGQRSQGDMRWAVSSEPNTRPGTAQEPLRPTQSARPQPVCFAELQSFAVLIRGDLAHQSLLGLFLSP